MNINSKPNIYISLTSIFQNQNVLLSTLFSIKRQTVLPTKIFLYLSESAYLLDQGFKDKIITNKHLNKFLKDNSDLFEVRFVENDGPYRKLLPLLKEKWSEDCLIITLDDDTYYVESLIKNLINDYMTHRCVISYKGFTPTCTSISNLTYENRCALITPRHHLNFPIGKAGILYHPFFFHKTGDLIFNKSIYQESCKTADDVWIMISRVLNGVDCVLINRDFMLKDNTTKYALFSNYNKYKNTEYIKKVILQLREIIPIP